MSFACIWGKNCCSRSFCLFFFFILFFKFYIFIWVFIGFLVSQKCVGNNGVIGSVVKLKIFFVKYLTVCYISFIRLYAARKRTEAGLYSNIKEAKSKISYFDAWQKSQFWQAETIFILLEVQNYSYLYETEKMVVEICELEERRPRWLLVLPS